MLLPGKVFADTLNDAVADMQAHRYEAALEKLSTTKDVRAHYYRAYAYERLGDCDAARANYLRSSRSPEAAPAQKKLAIDALSGLAGRCRANPAVAVEHVSAPTSVGWHVLGWTTLIVGGLTLAAIPVKAEFESNAEAQSALYFDQRFGCTPDGTSVDGKVCDRTGLERDEGFALFQEKREEAQTITNIMWGVGGGLVGVGAITLLTVAVSDAPVVVGVTPNGAQISTTF